jgi:hypothetical protein
MDESTHRERRIHVRTTIRRPDGSIREEFVEPLQEEKHGNTH